MYKVLSTEIYVLRSLELKTVRFENVYLYVCFVDESRSMHEKLFWKILLINPHYFGLKFYILKTYTVYIWKNRAVNPIYGHKFKFGAGGANYHTKTSIFT